MTLLLMKSMLPCENAIKMKVIWMLIFIRLLPIAVAIKKVQKLIKSFPQINPAKSNKGLGTEARTSTVMKE